MGPFVAGLPATAHQTGSATPRPECTPRRACQPCRNVAMPMRSLPCWLLGLRHSPTDAAAVPACACPVHPACQSGVVMGGTAILSAVNGLTPHMAGAIDIMVVQQPDGTLKCSPFYGACLAFSLWHCPWQL